MNPVLPGPRECPERTEPGHALPVITQSKIRRGSYQAARDRLAGMSKKCFVDPVGDSCRHQPYPPSIPVAPTKLGVRGDGSPWYARPSPQ